MAALKVQLKLLRLGLALRAYNPGQLRIPAGSPGGGQWTDGDSTDSHTPADDAEIIRIGDRNDDRYRVDLEKEEGRGHTLRDHVGKTDDDMMQRVLRERARSPFVSTGRRRDGSFPSIEAAHDFVNRTLENNSTEVDAVAEGRQARGFVTYRFGSPTGREAYSTADIEPYMRTTYSVGVAIVHDPSTMHGYRVITAYPRNDGD